MLVVVGFKVPEDVVVDTVADSDPESEPSEVDKVDEMDADILELVRAEVDVVMVELLLRDEETLAKAPGPGVGSGESVGCWLAK